MCDHHADALFFSELFSLLNMASGDAGASGGSLCAWRFGGDLALDSKRVIAGSPHARRRQGAHATDAAESISRRRERVRDRPRFDARRAATCACARECASFSVDGKGKNTTKRIVAVAFGCFFQVTCNFFRANIAFASRAAFGSLVRLRSRGRLTVEAHNRVARLLPVASPVVEPPFFRANAPAATSPVAPPLRSARGLRTRAGDGGDAYVLENESFL